VTSFSFGATGLLAKQIAEGAPFDVFAAANLSFVDDAIKAGACEADTKAIYAEGRIVLWTKGAAGLPLASLADLARPEIVHVAIANPDHAPYGKAAKEALVKSGVWDAIEKKIVYGENVQQTLQFAQSGNADVAIVALSLATVSGGHATPIDPSLHAPLKQAHRRVPRRARSRTGPWSRTRGEFAAFVASTEGRAILSRHGFVRARARTEGPLFHAREVHDEPLAAPRDERRHVDRDGGAVEVSPELGAVDAKVADAVVLLARLDPACAVHRDVDAATKRACEAFGPSFAWSAWMSRA
jgi:molybdate transport system substrate-binding protein